MGDTYAGSGQGHKIDKQRETYKKYNQNLNFPKKHPTSQITDIPAKCKLLMPHRIALALIDDGWICRNDIIWYKPSHMPESVKDRLTTTSEFVFHFVKQRKYYYDLDAIREPYKDSTKQRVQQNNGNPIWNGNRKRGHPNSNEETLDPDQFTHPKGKNPGDHWEITPNPSPTPTSRSIPRSFAEGR